MNKSQQYINDYINSGVIEYRPALTPIPQGLRAELKEHCENSKYWSKVAGGYKCGIHGGIVINFRIKNGGIAHDY